MLCYNSSMDSKKIILQTAGATFAAIAIFIVFVFNIAALIMPARLGAAYDMAGSKHLALSLGRVAYERSGEVYDLSILVERAIKYNDYSQVVRYAPQLMQDDNYAKLCGVKDQQLDTAEFEQMDSDYNSYIEGNYIASLYFSGDYSNCQVSIGNAMQNGYNRASPVRFFASTLSREGIFYAQLANMLEQRYSALSDSPGDTEQKLYLSIDLYALYNNSDDAEKLQYWQNLALMHIGSGNN